MTDNRCMTYIFSKFINFMSLMIFMVCMSFIELVGPINFFSALTYANPPAPLEIILDADFSNNYESSDSIRKGFETALRKMGKTYHQRELKLITMDHRGNSKRSKKHIKSFTKNKNAIAMIAGMHSPPLLAHKEFINKNDVLFLVPWAAAGPITRPDNDKNWIYRLSIDDRKAGGYLARYAAKKLNSKSPCLLLENTGWGKSNNKNMTAGFKKLNISVKDVFWFNWGLRENVSYEIANRIESKNCDLVLLVASGKEGQHLIKAISKLRNSIPVLSHWGITGGNFHELVDHETRSRVDLKFIQTKFNFNNLKLNTKQSNILKDVVKTYPEIREASDIKASTGFVHAYDLGLIFLNALAKAKYSDDINIFRQNIKKELENPNLKIRGLLKTYHHPFKPYGKTNPDAHEALGEEDYAIGIYDLNDTIINLK